MTDYFVSDATGNDTDSGLTEALAFLTIDRAMNAVAAGDKVWVKADGTYTETATMDTAGLLVTAPIVVEGYTTTIGDGGFATTKIDGESTRTNCVNTSLGNVRLHYIWKSFEFTLATGDGFLGGSTDSVEFRHCRSHNNASDGFEYDNDAAFYRCEIDNNTQTAVNGDTDFRFFGCTIHDNGNTTQQLLVQLGHFAFNEFYGANSAAEHVRMDSAGNFTPVLWINNTMDGEAGATTDGLNMSNVSGNKLWAINSIFYDLDNGILMATDTAENVLVANNLFNSNATSDRPSSADEEGTVTGAPQFTDEVAHDYEPAAGSVMLEAGLDAADATT